MWHNSTCLVIPTPVIEYISEFLSCCNTVAISCLRFGACIDIVHLNHCYVIIIIIIVTCTTQGCWLSLKSPKKHLQLWRRYILHYVFIFTAIFFLIFQAAPSLYMILPLVIWICNWHLQLQGAGVLLNVFTVTYESFFLFFPKIKLTRSCSPQILDIVHHISFYYGYYDMMPLWCFSAITSIYSIMFGWLFHIIHVTTSIICCYADRAMVDLEFVTTCHTCIYQESKTSTKFIDKVWNIYAELKAQLTLKFDLHSILSTLAVLSSTEIFRCHCLFKYYFIIQNKVFSSKIGYLYVLGERDIWTSVDI